MTTDGWEGRGARGRTEWGLRSGAAALASSGTYQLHPRQHLQERDEVVAISQVFIEVVDVLAYLRGARGRGQQTRLPSHAQCRSQECGRRQRCLPLQPFKMALPEPSLRKAASRFPTDQTHYRHKTKLSNHPCSRCSRSTAGRALQLRSDAVVELLTPPYSLPRHSDPLLGFYSAASPQMFSHGSPKVFLVRLLCKILKVTKSLTRFAKLAGEYSCDTQRPNNFFLLFFPLSK